MKLTKEILKTGFNYFKNNRTFTSFILCVVLFLVTPFQCEFKSYKVSKGGIKYLSTEVSE